MVHATVVLSPHGNARYFLDGNRSLWYILLRYSATTVMYGIFYGILYFLGLLSRACGVAMPVSSQNTKITRPRT